MQSMIANIEVGGRGNKEQAKKSKSKEKFKRKMNERKAQKQLKQESAGEASKPLESLPQQAHFQPRQNAYTPSAPSYPPKVGSAYKPTMAQQKPRVFKERKVVKQEEKEEEKVMEEEEEEKEPERGEVFSGETFDQLDINDKLKQILKENNFINLTSIQKQAIPVILKEKNVVLKSETGSGKTLAYLVPLLEYLSKKSLQEERITRAQGTYCIIFSPTRELCVQIEIELKKLLKLFNFIVCGTITGGENPKKEKQRLRKGLHVIICTPGRFLYHLQQTQSMELGHLAYLVFDEADRMLDLGFEREMTQCLGVIKQKAKGKFEAAGPDNYWSDSIRVNFVSATLSRKIEELGKKLMREFVTVGFHGSSQAGGGEEESKAIVQAIPRQTRQLFAEVPTQYRLLYLVAFLYAHQGEKLILFVSNCEMVNFLWTLMGTLDWKLFGIKDADAEIEAGEKKDVLFSGAIYKLHGQMDHQARKHNYFGFDSKAHALLICTDVASRGLDFKGVDWVLQYDPSSQIKEYVNRIGRTARMAEAGQSICFLMAEEMEYVSFLEKEYGVKMEKRDRFWIVKAFTKKLSSNRPDIRFKVLKNIEDKDEQQEQLHAIRHLIRRHMHLDSLTSLAQVARSSSTRAYAGHSAGMRHIFDLKKLNLTEFARSFALYKSFTGPKEQWMTQKRNHPESSKDGKGGGSDENEKLFTKRLKKAKQKELERELRDQERAGDAKGAEKTRRHLLGVKREVYVDEFKAERRKKGFERAKLNLKKETLSEFM